MAWENVQYENGKFRTSQGGGGGGASNLADLEDVNLTNPSSGQIIKYDGATSKWINENLSMSLNNISDVSISGLSSNQVLKYDSQVQKWINDYQDLSKLGDVSIQSLKDKQSLVYDSNLGYFINDYADFYSYQEQKSGKWVDGSVVYKKVYYYNVTSTITAGTTNICNTGTGIKPISISAFSRNKTSGRVYVLPFVNGSATCSIRWDESGYIAIVVANDSWSTNYEFYITLEYTKNS